MKLNRIFIIILSSIFLCLGCGETQAQNAVLKFDMAKLGAPVSPDLFGIFFEEINHGGEGGLYGESIVNRSFDDDYGSFYGWTWQNAECALTKQNLLNNAQRNACKTTFNNTNGYLRNSGFGGIKLVKNNAYKVTLWVRAEGETFDGNISARLVDNTTGVAYGVTNFSGPFTQEWKKCEGIIRPTANINNGAFQLQVSSPCTLVFDMVSCFPPTFKDRENGMRKDLAQMLADMKPRFMRFPGGCYVEGRTGWDREPGNNTRWEWKKTIGPVEERPGHRNQQWGYWVSDGQGYHEFLQFCEDIGSAAMFVCNVGMGHGWVQDYRNIGEYIQEVLDAIEYANGDSTTVWGRKRAQNGHPEPFNLKYVEIGNENCNFNFGDNSDQSDHYFERYIQFYNAIKTYYPEVKTIANVEAWATDFPSWRSNYPVELVDEHYYRDANFYINNYEKYNGYARSGAEVYIGEYAANIGGGIGNLNNALAEAIFMQGMENNSDIVKMASFAPIFMNETYGGWDYDIIRFNHQTSYGIPSYYVQKMFGNHQGKFILPWTEENNIPQLSAGDRQIGVGTWLTTATFSDVLMTSPEGEVFFDQKANNSSVWTRGSGTWAYVNGTIRQTNTATEGATFICNQLLPNENFDLTLKATKTGGQEGFLIVFNYKDSQNYTWWNIGGWGNSAFGVENCINGARTTLTRKEGILENNHAYDIRIEKRDSRVKCYLDGELIHECDIPAGYAKGVFTSASYDDTTNEAIVKLTNPNPSELPLTLTFENATPLSVSGEIITSTYATDLNTTGNPTNVVPKDVKDAKVTEEGNVVYSVPAYSFNILRVALSDMAPQQEPPSLPTPAVTYSFEQGKAVSDDGRFPASMLNGAGIRELTDGNHVLYTGNIGGKGFVNLGTDMPKAVFSTADYTISLDVLNRSDNNLNAFCWALALSNGTDQYFGFINAGGNRDWYAELKDGNAVSVRSGASLRSSRWHNLTYVQNGSRGLLYVDGKLRGTSNVNINLRNIVSTLNGCYLGRSPFSADAYMENTYFDNLIIYNEALTAEQVAVIGETAATMADDENAQMNNPVELRKLIEEVKSVEKYADNRELTSALNHAIANQNGVASDLKKEQEALLTAFENYKKKQWENVENGKEANLSFLLRNGSFTCGSLYWSGAEIGAVGNETAEQFNRSFDSYQIIRQLPAGQYRVEADAFYRAGSIEEGYKRWQSDKSAALMCDIYMQPETEGIENAGTKIHSLYDCTSYTYSPYTYPDNLTEASIALNSNDRRYENSFVFELGTEADARIGIRKNEGYEFDWVAFDNFRLYYLSEPTSIRQEEQPSGKYNSEVYDLSGRKVTDSKHLDSKLHYLKPGVYIIQGKKQLKY